MPPASHLAALVLAASTLPPAMAPATTSSASAASLTATWTGGSGTWSTPSMWDLSTVPNNDAVNTYSVLIDGGKIATISAVGSLGTNPVISGLAIDTGDTLYLSGNTLTLTSGATFSNDGIIAFNPAGNIVFQGDTTISGDGTINVAYGSLSTTTPTSRLTIGPGQTITLGSLGSISMPLTLTNNGLIDGSSIYSATSATSYNAGTIKASTLRSLAIDSAKIDNTAGTLIADGTGAKITCYNVSITNGELKGINSGTIVFSSPTCSISDLTLTGKISGGAIVGGTITNNATWTGSFRLSAPTTLDGNGTITISGNIYANNSTDRLTINAGQTLTGPTTYGLSSTGGLRMALTNHGTIQTATGTLTLTPIGIFFNTGTILASNGAALKVRRAIVDNTGGTFSASGANGTLTFEKVTLTGGSIIATSGAAITVSLISEGDTSSFADTSFLSDVNGRAPMTLSNVTFAGNINSIYTASVSGTVTWPGAWNASGSGINPVAMVLAAPTTIAGNGTLNFSGCLYAQNGTDRLTVESGQTLSGYGDLGLNWDVGARQLALTNRGLITTTGSLGITLSTSVPSYNTGTIQATGGRRIGMDGIDNAGGLITAIDPGSVIHFAYGTVSGGTIAATDGATVEITNGVTINTRIDVGSGAFARIFVDSMGGSHVEAIANNGTLTVSDPNATTGPITGTGSTILLAGGSLTAASLRQNALTLHGTAAAATTKLSLAESSPGASTGTASGDDAMVSIVRSLSIDHSGPTYFATLDLSNNDLLIDYTGSTSPLAQIESMLRSGYNAGTWTGKGLTSSTAAADSGSYALVVLDNAKRPTPFTIFDDISVPTTVVIVKFSWVADLDLDGLVTSNDAIVFANNYAEGAPATHLLGDLNYNGVFDSNDAILFANAYNETLPHLPEPTSLGFLALGATALIVRRRGRRSQCTPSTRHDS